MTKIYIILSYVLIAFAGFLGLRHIDNLNDKVELQALEIESMKQSQIMVIEAYNQEIEELTKSAKERKVVVKEIVKTVKGTKDEECLNRTIPSNVLDKLRKQNNDKK